MSDLQKPKRPKRPAEAKPKPKLELIRINPVSPPDLKPKDEPLPVPLETPTARKEESDGEPEVAPKIPKGILPIVPPTELLQYRAIGLIHGRFVPEEEEPNMGTLVTGDGQAISCVVLGKMLAILKRKLQPDRSYLWVVYPRTQAENGGLHVQITGVWAPVELGRSELPIDPGFPDGYFSIRGEVVQVSPDRFVVKIKRTDAKAAANQALRKFKLKILGVLPQSAVGYFWDLAVQREGSSLRLIEGTSIELIPKKPYVRNKGKGKPLPKNPVQKPQRKIDRPKPIPPKK